MKTIQVVASIIHQDGKILATQRGYGEYKGLWEFPGGKMEPGETEEQAIVREIREELNVEIGVEKKVCTVEYDYPTFVNGANPYDNHWETSFDWIDEDNDGYDDRDDGFLW